MLPMGLHFKVFKSPKKLPMRLEQSVIEDFKTHIYKIANIPCPTEEKPKKNKTKNKTKTKTKTKKNI